VHDSVPTRQLDGSGKWDLIGTNWTF